MISAYPDKPAERNRWIETMRGRKNLLDPLKPYACLNEREAAFDSATLPTATIFLTNRECPFRCLMCDLWQNTLNETVQIGAIPAQIRFALKQLNYAKKESRKGAQIKLYNAGSFFDPNAIHPEEYAEIAELISGFDRVIVESHPAFLGDRTFTFQRMLDAKLEIAVGLETANPVVLAKLNKGITLDSFKKASDLLKDNDIALRVFILLRPPFLTEEEGVFWAKKSLDFSMECGAEIMCLIPTRGGNGAMEILSDEGSYSPPNLESLRETMKHGLAQKSGRIYADLWDIEKFAVGSDAPQQILRLSEMNRLQQRWKELT